MERIFLSHYGLDVDQYINHPRGQLRAELNISGQQRIVGMVAYMYAPKWYLGQRRGLKGHEDLIDALAICQAQDPNIAGVFIGGASSKVTTYENRVRAYGREKCGDKIFFLGTRSDIPALYPDFDLAVCPSHSENLGAAAESLLIPVPTIATNVGGLPDLIIPGQTGWLVPPCAPQDLARVIMEALGNSEYAQQMAQNGFDHTRNLMDVKRTARQVYDVYNTLLSVSKS